MHGLGSYTEVLHQHRRLHNHCLFHEHTGTLLQCKQKALRHVATSTLIISN